MIFSSAIYALAAPPISGGTLSCFVLIFASLGIPDGALAVVVALSPLVDRIVTPFKAIAYQCDLAYSAAKFGKIDRNVLKSRQ